VRFADLHLHTYHSDGVRSPLEVVELAARHHLGIISISDHDNLAAIDEAAEIGRQKSILVIPGIELSTEFRGVDVHLLAYAFDHHDENLEQRLESFRRTRLDRGRLMVEKLAGQGCRIRHERVLEICGNASLGRPHIARALIEQGVVSSMQEAFDRWLSPGRPGYVEKERFPTEEAIEVIHRIGGLTSVAHPTLYPNWLKVVSDLFDRGADAVEAYHPHVDADSRGELTGLAKDRRKFVTGGSDDHGMEDLRTIGSIRVPEGLIQPLLEGMKEPRQS
jgi:3',5'-nucleoside bisphosphate phosphatase